MASLQVIRATKFGQLRETAYTGALAIDRKHEYDGAIALLKRIALDGGARFQTFSERRENGVYPIVHFIEERDTVLFGIQGRIDTELDHIVGSRPGISFSHLNGNTKAYILQTLQPLFEYGFLRMQHALAGIEMPEESESARARHARFKQPSAFRPSAEANPKLGEFLDSMGVARNEFIGAVETLRDFLLPAGDSDFSSAKERLKSITTFIASAYIDLHLGGQLLVEERRD